MFLIKLVFHIIDYLKEDADVDRDVWVFSMTLFLTENAFSSPSKLTCWELVGWAQQTVRNPWQDPWTTPWFRRHPNMGSQKPPACRHDTVDRLKNYRTMKNIFQSNSMHFIITFKHEMFVHEYDLTWLKRWKMILRKFLPQTQLLKEQGSKKEVLND